MLTVNEATWRKMLFYLLFLFPFTTFPILCLVDTVTVLENFLSTEYLSLTLSNAYKSQHLSLRSMLVYIRDDWQFSFRRLLFYFRLESYELFERTKFAGKYIRTNTLIKHSHETSYEACYERIYEVPTNFRTKFNKTTPWSINILLRALIAI